MTKVIHGYHALTDYNIGATVIFEYSIGHNVIFKYKRHLGVSAVVNIHKILALHPRNLSGEVAVFFKLASPVIFFARYFLKPLPRQSDRLARFCLSALNKRVRTVLTFS